MLIKRKIVFGNDYSEMLNISIHIDSIRETMMEKPLSFSFLVSFRPYRTNQEILSITQNRFNQNQRTIGK